MGRKGGEKGHTATASSWADITAQGARGTRKGRKAVEEGKQMRVHAEREERELERETEINADEERSRHLRGQGLRHIPGQEVTGRSDHMKAVAPQTSAPTQAAVIQIECEGV